MILKEWKTTIIGGAMILFGAYLTQKGFDIAVTGAWLGGGIGLLCAKDAGSKGGS